MKYTSKLWRRGRVSGEIIDKSKNNALCYTYKSLTNKAFENMAKGHYF